MYPENPEGTQVIVGSMNIGYISDTARNRTHNLFRPDSQAGADTNRPQLLLVSFLSELSGLDGIQSCLVREYQDKCRELHEQAIINAPQLI